MRSGSSAAHKPDGPHASSGPLVYRSEYVDPLAVRDSIGSMARYEARARRFGRPGLRRWSRREYERLIDHGLLDEDDPIELLDGLLLVKEPQHSLHRTAVLLAAKAVEAAFGEAWFVQIQSPIILDDRSEPEPDVCVVRGSPRDYVDAHPRRPALVVEVAQSGLRLARGRKAAAYARAGIADYWIVNLADRVLEVHREPAPPGPARRHWSYAAIERLDADATISPLAAPSARVRVGDLLP